HGGSFYLGHNQEYSKKLWNEITANTGVLSREDNDNLWHDTYWKYLSMTNPQEAVNLYNSYPERNLKFGISDAQTYHWLHSVNAMGIVDATITANYPIAGVFKQNGQTTYVAHNYSNSEIIVTYSDGFQLTVPANQMVTNRDIDVSGEISSDFTQAYPNGSVNLSTTVSGSVITKVEFYDGSTLLGEDKTAPYEMKAENLSLGIHGFFSKVYQNDKFNVTNSINVVVGEQVPYSGAAFQIPGVIEPGNYDKFQGGVGQNISYLDLSLNNSGNYRTDEYVDSELNNSEGPVVGWFSAGEWMEYTVDVSKAGVYDLSFRYNSGNSNGGGPFYFEVEGNKISSDITLSNTGSWDSWRTKSVSGVELTKGENVLRLHIKNGEFNLGKMTFSYKEALSYVPPIADAGANVSIISPTTTGTLNGSGSNDPEGQSITYVWTQVYGPSLINFDSNTIASPNISNLVEGVYKFKLTVNDGTYSDTDEVLVIVSATGNLSPSVSITSPNDGTTFREDEDITITTITSDLDGTVTLVEFFDGATKIGEDSSDPFSIVWQGASVGDHIITTVATDNNDAKTTSDEIKVIVSEVKSCTEASSEAEQGSFSTGYKVNFETVGTNVTIKFELLDEDKVGVVAYLFKEYPFEESTMDHVSGLTFSKTLVGLTPGETISYACKFAYAGGQSVTKYFTYTIGNNCSGGVDTTAPENFTATIGNITSRSIEILVSATDGSGSIVYAANTNSTSGTINGDSGVQKSLIINNLQPETSYTFSVTAKDLLGNESSDNPIVLQANTSKNENTACSGSSGDSSEGSFSNGYEYSFETIGNEVKFTFELLDSEKTGVVAYLWKQSPFSEIVMDNVGGKKFTKTISGFTNGQTISYACKFAFAGGQSVTKYFSYTVGDTCVLGIEDNTLAESVKCYPNPAYSVLNIYSPIIDLTKVEIYSLIGKKLFDSTANLNQIYVDDLSNGLYFIKISSEKGKFITKFIKE
ncbi:MAG: carbohydrate-binding protein, partial [Polaribacter sp.]|nr:carbohydrate-binding protein [Polaribacter sp.]